jgi:hypothetical protein
MEVGEEEARRLLRLKRASLGLGMRRRRRLREGRKSEERGGELVAWFRFSPRRRKEGDVDQVPLLHPTAGGGRICRGWSRGVQGTRTAGEELARRPVGGGGRERRLRRRRGRETIGLEESA